MLSNRFFFISSTLIMILMLIQLPFITGAFLPLWAILFWGSLWLSGNSWADLRRERHEREADTTKPSPSENGAEAEPFGKRDTTAYMIEKGRTNRW